MRLSHKLLKYNTTTQYIVAAASLYSFKATMNCFDFSKSVHVRPIHNVHGCCKLLLWPSIPLAVAFIIFFFIAAAIVNKYIDWLNLLFRLAWHRLLAQPRLLARLRHVYTAINKSLGAGKTLRSWWHVLSLFWLRRKHRLFSLHVKCLLPLLYATYIAFDRLFFTSISCR